MNKVSGIYGIRSLSHPERVYIGSSVNLKRRKSKHFRELEGGGHHSAVLQHHYNKYGANDLVFEIIIYCERGVLIIMEQVFIDLYNPWFNICPIAGNPMEGRTHSVEAKRKISSAVKSRAPMSTKTRVLIGASRRGNTDWRGRSHSEETKIKMSKPKSDETKKRMSEAQKRRFPVSEATREKRRKNALGKHPSVETRAKMSLAHMGNKSNLGRHLSAEHRENISKANWGKSRSRRGRRHSEETKKK